jgi:branched-chain amino acid transport system ATP-binding protein
VIAESNSNTALAADRPVDDGLLVARALDVRFGGVHALDQMDLRVARGSIHGIIGPNGSGKSTLLGVLSRLTPLDGGTLWFDGEDYTSLPAPHLASRGLARTFQTVRLLPALTVLENVMVGVAPVAGTGDFLRQLARSRRGPADEAALRECAMEHLRTLGIEDVASLRPSALPYGLARRVEIARALATKPRLLLVDEPTAGMSRTERSDIGRTLAALPGAGCSVVVVEHDVDMITTYCDSATAMSAGRVIAAGTPTVVVNNPDVQEAYMGRWADDWS